MPVFLEQPLFSIQRKVWMLTPWGKICVFAVLVVKNLIIEFLIMLNNTHKIAMHFLNIKQNQIISSYPIRAKKYKPCPMGLTSRLYGNNLNLQYINRNTEISKLSTRALVGFVVIVPQRPDGEAKIISSQRAIAKVQSHLCVYSKYTSFNT